MEHKTPTYRDIDNACTRAHDAAGGGAPFELVELHAADFAALAATARECPFVPGEAISIVAWMELNEDVFRIVSDHPPRGVARFVRDEDEFDAPLFPQER